MSKLYLVHLRPLGLHGILVVVLSTQVPVVPSCPWDNPGHPRNPPLFYTNLPVPDAKLPWDNPGHPGNLHYLTPSCQSQVRVVPCCHGTTQDIPGTPHQPASPRSKLPWDNSGHPRNLTLPYTILLSQVAMGQPRTSREPPNTLHQPASPRCKLSQVAMGQPRTSQEPPTIPYTIPPVPGPSCPKLPWDKLPWDNPGHPRNSPLPYTNLLVPGPSCHGTTQDIPGTPTTLQQTASPWSELSQGHPGNLPLPYTILQVPGPSCPKLPCMGQLGTSREPPTTLHHPASPRSKLSQVAMHGTTRDIPGTSHYLTPSCKSQVQVVPSCHACDNPGHPGNLPLPYTILQVPGPSCPKLPWDNPGHPGNPPLPYTTLPVPGSETANS